MNFDEAKHKPLDLFGYDSPIRVFAKNIAQDFDGRVLKEIREMGIYVDKNELIKALQYDRNQYEKGFDDGVKVGVRNRDNQIVRCKDCKYWATPFNGEEMRDIHVCMKEYGLIGVCAEEDYCVYGERCEE